MNITILCCTSMISNKFGLNLETVFSYSIYIFDFSPQLLQSSYSLLPLKIAWVGMFNNLWNAIQYSYKQQQGRGALTSKI